MYDWLWFEASPKDQNMQLPLFCVVLGDCSAAFGALINKRCFADQYFGFTTTVNPGQLSLS